MVAAFFLSHIDISVDLRLLERKGQDRSRPYPGCVGLLEDTAQTRNSAIDRLPRVLRNWKSTSGVKKEEGGGQKKSSYTRLGGDAAMLSG